MRNLIFTLACIILTLQSCSYVENYNKPTLELTGSNPYQLNVANFQWSYGVTAINQFNGDFDKLDQKVFNLLQGKSGICQVRIENRTTDKYGKSDTSMLYVGDINIDELNKYQDWSYWQKESGIRKMIYSKLFARPSMDSVRTDSVKTEPMQQDTATYARPAKTVSLNYTYHFAIDDLYPTEEDLSNLDQHRFKINGTIGDVNFNSGVFILNSTDGEQLTIQFYPTNASSAIGEQLLIAIKPGNKIKSVCARAGASTLDLVSAEISEQ